MMHCWKDELEHIEETYGYLSEKYIEHCGDHWFDDYDGTCMLEAGHDGDHEFTDTSELLIRFADPFPPEDLQ